MISEYNQTYHTSRLVNIVHKLLCVNKTSQVTLKTCSKIVWMSKLKLRSNFYVKIWAALFECCPSGVFCFKAYKSIDVRINNKNILNRTEKTYFEDIILQFLISVNFFYHFSHLIWIFSTTLPWVQYWNRFKTNLVWEKIRVRKSWKKLQLYKSCKGSCKGCWMLLTN